MPTQIDVNGWAEKRDNPLSCVGVYPYLGKDIPGAPDPGKIYYVYRPEEELANPECINSFKLVPWIDEHAMLGEEYTAPEHKGVQGVIGEDVYYRDGTLFGNIKIWGNNLKNLISSGKRELSCGYRCMYEAAQGVFNGQRFDYIQRCIRGNHLALVDQGRMGAGVAVMDNAVAGALTFSLDSMGLTMADEPNDNKQESGGGSAMTLAEISALLEEIMPVFNKMKAALADAPAEVEAVTVDADEPDEKDKGMGMDTAKTIAAMDAQLKAMSKELAGFKQGGTKALLAEISQRDSLYNQGSKLVGAFDHSQMTLDEVAKYLVQKIGIACDSGHELSVLKGYFHNRQSAPALKVVSTQDGKPKGQLSDFINANGGNV
jgi:uncharacterized protein